MTPLALAAAIVAAAGFRAGGLTAVVGVWEPVLVDFWVFLLVLVELLVPAVVPSPPPWSVGLPVEPCEPELPLVP